LQTIEEKEDTMRRAGKLTGILALLALCACASSTTSTGTRDTDGTGTSAKKVDCSTVRCASCPTGQHPALTPPDCCRCIPD
jgi:ABC-type phosphate transport system substrate-binding protein